ncbi:MAG: PKD domain-containing protein [Bacteroidia bacterium]
MKRFIYLLLLLFSSFSSYATHIVGAQLYYECLNPVTNTYQVTLKLYRDCLNGQAPYDNPLHLFIFDASGSIYQTIAVPIPPITPQITPNWGPCVTTTPNLCIEEGIYITTLTLPPSAGGYDIAWARCCRNSAINNLVTPLGEGVTFLAHVPDPGLADCNTMPIFNNTPPLFFCQAQTATFDYSATDIDGDSLYYALTNPYTGTNFAGLGAVNPNITGGGSPIINPTTNPMGPPIYNNVVFSPGHNFTNPFGPGSTITLDPQSGSMVINPANLGIFVMAVSVFEYRNGQLLSENKQDIQVHVLACLPQEAPPDVTFNFGGAQSNLDTVFMPAQQVTCIDIQVFDSIMVGNLLSTLTTPLTSNPTFNLTTSGVNPLNGIICWEPQCSYVGQTIPVIIKGEDTGDCPGFGVAFDTFYIHVYLPPNTAPLISPNYTGLNLSNDTILVNATNTLCYPFTINDPEGDSLSLTPLSPIFSATNGATITLNNTTSPITGQVCWTPDCALANQTIQLSFLATDYSACNVTHTDTTSIYVLVQIPPNTPPQLTINLNNTTHNGDTVIVEALDSFCFNLSGIDIDTATTLTLVGSGAVFTGTNPPTLVTSGTNPMAAQLCWTPDCQYADQLLMLVFDLTDTGVCNNAGDDKDTVYVKVTLAPNAPPNIVHNLAGNTVNGDTIFIDALDNFCYDFTVNDANSTQTLTATPLSPVFTGANAPTFTVTGTNPLSGEICWTPDCQYVGQVIPFEIQAVDNAICNTDSLDKDTVYIKISIPPNNPPAALHDLTGNTFANDTIYCNAFDANCYQVVFSDINAQDSLTWYGLSPITQGSATITATGWNPLTLEVCWTPDCSYEGQVVPLIIGATDNGKCNNLMSVTDTVFIKISDPVPLPPIVTHNFGNLQAVGDTLYMYQTDSLCYSFAIQDLTLSDSILYSYTCESVVNGGYTLLSYPTATYNNGTLSGQMCIYPSCANGGSMYRLIIKGIDDIPCPPSAESSDTIFIKVNTNFYAISVNDTAFCAGTGGVQLNVTPWGGAGAPYYYTWNCVGGNGCGISTPYVPNPVVNPPFGTTTYLVQMADVNGCTSEIDSVDVTILPLPIVDAGRDTTICQGGFGVFLQPTVINQSQVPPPYTYTWFPGTGLNDSTLWHPFAHPNTTTIYTLVVTAPTGCSSLVTTLDTLSTVTINVNPTPIVNAGPTQAVCAGDSIMLQGFASGAGATYNYQWTPNLGLTNGEDTLATPISAPPFTTTYTLVAEANGCYGSDTTTLYVHTLPTANAGVSYEICGQDSVKLIGLADGDWDNTATYTYTWSPPIGLSSQNVYEPMASPPTTTTYTLTVNSSHGCVSDDYQATVRVLPTPLAAAGKDTLVCGNSLVLNGSYSWFNGLSSGQTTIVSWNPNNLTSPDHQLQTNATLTGDNTFYLTVQTGACATTDSIHILSSPSLNANIEIAGDTSTICEGDTLQLIATGGNGNPSYQWSPNTNISNIVAPTPWVYAYVNMTYVLMMTEGFCREFDTISLKVNPRPIADYIQTFPKGCAPLNVHFENLASNEIAYIWNFGDGQAVNNQGAISHIFENVGVYPVSLTVVGAGGCAATYQNDAIEVLPPPTADFTLSDQALLLGKPINFVNQSQNASSYLWDFGSGTYISTEENPSYTFKEAKEWVIKLLASNEYCSSSISKIFAIKAPHLFVPNVFSPNGDGTHDTFLIEYDGNETFQLEIFDRWGSPIFLSTDVKKVWTGEEQGTGVYYYLLSIGSKEYRGNVTLMR